MKENQNFTQEPKDEDIFHSKGRKDRAVKSVFAAFAAFAVRYLSVNSVSLLCSC